MPQTFSFEEATSPTPAQPKPSGGKTTFSFEEAQAAPSAPKSGPGEQIEGGAETVLRAIPGVSEFQAGAVSPIVALQHHESIPAAYSEGRKLQDKTTAAFKVSHPNIANLLTGTGYTAPVLAGLLTGGAAEAPEAVGAAKGPLEKFLSVLNGTGKNAVAGAGASAVYGAAQPGSVKDRLKAANKAILPGAALGVAAPAAVGALKAASEHIAAPVARTLWRGANAVMEHVHGESFSDAAASATSRLRESLHADRVSPADIEAAIKDWSVAGAGSPKLHAVAGRNTLTLLRAAAEKHEAANIAEKHAADVRGSLSPSSQKRAAKLTPDDHRTASQFMLDTKAAQKAEADSNYPPVYAERVQPTHEALKPFKTRKGQKSLNTAIANAEEREPHFVSGSEELADLKAMKKYLADHTKYENNLAVYKAQGGAATVPEFLTLKDGSKIPLRPGSVLRQVMGEAKPIAEPKPPKIPEMSAAALDRLSIGTKRTGRNLFKEHPEIGGAVAKHAEAIDQMLNAIEGMPESKAAFKTRAEQLRAMNDVKAALTEPEESFVPKVEAMSPAAKTAAQVRVRQTLENAFGRKSRDVLAGITNVAENPAVKKNLDALFGPEDSGKLTKFAQLKLNEFKSAQQIAPSHNSQTFGRSQGEGASAMEAVHTIKGGPLAWLNRLMTTGATMTRKEREALVKLGLQDELPDVLKQVFAAQKTKLPVKVPSRKMIPAVAAPVGAAQQNRD